MKVISETLHVENNSSGLRAPSKPDIFKKRKNAEAEIRTLCIPEDNSCITESRSPCLAAKYVKLLKKFHKKLRYQTLNCVHCSRADVALTFNTGRNIICNFNLPKLCILDNELKCPRVSQVRSWLIKCRYLRHLMKKCINHRNLITNLKNNAALQLSILLEISK